MFIRVIITLLLLQFFMGCPATDVFPRTVNTGVEKPANLGDICNRLDMHQQQAGWTTSNAICVRNYR